MTGRRVANVATALVFGTVYRTLVGTVIGTVFGALLGCPGPRHPRGPVIEPLTLPLGSVGAVRGVASTGTLVVAALDAVAPPGGSPSGSVVAAVEPGPQTVVEARRGLDQVWRAEFEGRAGPLAASPDLVFASLVGTATVAGAPIRGEPGGAIVALDASTGKVRWTVPLDASEWIVLAAVAAVPDGVVVGGSFSGSVRVGAQVVTSGGRSDGFVAKLTAAGQVAWLIRVGGGGPDAVQGVAAHGEAIAIAGTFAAGADLLGESLPAFDERSPYTDGFVARLTTSGTRTWVAAFGGKLAESVVGVAFDRAGRIAVAANARDVVHVGGADLVTQGPADGLVAWWSADGTALGATLLGGTDFDGLRAITTAGDHVLVGGFYSGEMRLGDRTITAGGGDDAFLATLDHRSSVLATWPITGPGREEITALATLPGGFIAGIAHTAAASLAGTSLPTAGSALLIRPAR